MLRQRVKGKNLELNMEYPENIPRYLKGDPTRIRQIVINLVGNAIKFTNEGKVTVTVKATQEGIAAYAEIVGMEISVKDTGIGIPPEKHQAIFESFTQVDSSITRTYGARVWVLRLRNPSFNSWAGTYGSIRRKEKARIL